METIYKGYKNEEEYRKKLVQHIKNTIYDNVKNICSELEYAISYYDLIRLSEAYKKGDDELKNKIEYILTDCNFHSECSLLINGEADTLIKISKEQIEKSLEKCLGDIFRNEYINNRDHSYLPANSTVLEEYSIEEMYFLVDRGFIQKRNCEGLAFELTDKEKELINQKNNNQIMYEPIISQKYNAIVQRAMNETTTGNYIIDLKNDYELTETDIMRFKELAYADERISDVEFSEDGSMADINFFLENCPNVEQEEEL